MKKFTSKLLFLLLFGHLNASISSAVETNSWRNGGKGTVPGATPPIFSDTEGQIRWKTATKAWANASPVKFGSQICITEEPVTLACFDTDNGLRNWSTTNNYTDTLKGDGATEGLVIFEILLKNEERIREIQIQLSKLQRDLRRSSSGPEVQQQYEAHLSQMNELIDFRSANKQFLLPEDKGIIGYATPTPTVIDGHIYTLFGNGVLSKFSESGHRIWAVWLGAPTEPMLGHITGTSSSLLMVDGVLLAPFGKLRGIDPSNGDVLWEGAAWPHYGTPGIMNVDGQAVIITPGGEIIRPSDGETIGPNIGQIEYVGPVVVGDTVYSIGWTRLEDGKTTVTIGRAHKLFGEEGGRIGVRKLWERHLSKERTYASPLIKDGRIFVLYWQGKLEVLSTASGELLSTALDVPGAQNGSPSATEGNDRVVIAFEGGEVQTYSLADQPKLLDQAVIERQRATPLLDGKRIYLRGMKYLYCIE